MPRNAKSLKRNDGERKGILIAPLKLPRISVLKFLRFDFSYLRCDRWVGFGAVVRKNSTRALLGVNASTYLRPSCPVKREDRQKALLDPTARVPS